jgi:hypothetical protein
MRNFLAKAEESVDRGKLTAEEGARIKRVLSYRNEHDAVEQKAGFDLTNMEQLFGLVELHSRVEPSFLTLRDDFVFLILKTLEVTIQKELEWECQVPCTTEQGPHVKTRHASVSEHFVDVVAQRWEMPPPQSAKHSIISLNYDLVIERAMLSRSLQPIYGLDASVPVELAIPNHLGIKLLKLHGSANWAICTKIGCERIEILSPDETAVAQSQRTCTSCASPMQPLIVPPTWSKGERKSGLASVWREAFAELVAARRWILIGVSLAESDLFLRYLFGLAIKTNTVLDHILLIDPAETGFDRLFEHRPKRITFDHIHNDFQSAVAGANLQLTMGHRDYPGADPAW